MPPTLGDTSSTASSTMSSPSQTPNQTGRGGSAHPTMTNLGVDRTVPRPRDDSQLIAKLGMFVDHTANTARLDIKHRGFLHEFKEYVMDMPPTHWRALIHLQATALRTAQAVEKLTGEVEQVKTDIDEVAVQSSKTFLMTPDRNTTIRKLCKRLIVEPSRVDYENIADNARDVLKETYPDFEPAFKAERSKAYVMAACRSSANYVRNSYRKALKDSLFNPQGRCGLTKFAKILISKFDPDRKLTSDFIIHLAILRRFCLENPAALDCEDLPEWIPPDYLASLHPIDAPKTGKRKRESRPFWELAQEYIENKIKENGEDLNSEKWHNYLSETIREEQKIFPDDSLPLLPQLPLPDPVAFSAPSDPMFPNLSSLDDMLGVASTHAQVHGTENEAVPRMSPTPHVPASPRTPASTLSRLPTASPTPSASFVSYSSGPIPQSSIHLPRLSELAQTHNTAPSPATVSPAMDWLASAGGRSSSAAVLVADPDAPTFNFDVNSRSSRSQSSHRPW